MRVIRLGLSLLPLGYIGWLLFYFLRPEVDGDPVTGPALMPGRVMTDGLGPTVIGLGVVGLVLCLPVLFRVALLFAPAPRPPARRTMVYQGGAFDADAALDRYLAQGSGRGRGGRTHGACLRIPTRIVRPQAGLR